MSLLTRQLLAGLRSSSKGVCLAKAATSARLDNKVLSSNSSRMHAMLSEARMKEDEKIYSDHSQTGTETQARSVKKIYKKTEKPFDPVSQPIETPRLDKYSSQLIDTVTSIDVSNKLIAWITVNSNGDVTDWNFAHIDSETHSDDFSSNNNIQSDYKKIWDVYETSLPKDSSAYLFETRRYKAADVRIVPFLMRIHRSEVILQSIYETKIRLDQRKSLESKTAGGSDEESSRPDQSATKFQKVYTINSRRVALGLDLFIGNERINSTNMVDELIKYRMSKPVRRDQTGEPQPETEQPPNQERVKLATKEKYALNVPVDLMGFYLVKISEQSKYKEAMAKCYLQASCFLNSLRLVKSSESS